MTKAKRFAVINLILFLGLLAAAAISLSWGSYKIPLSQIPSVLMGRGTDMENFAVFTLRLPRIALAVVVGTALSTAGCLLQTVTGNPLADSGLIGINAGASLAAVLFITSQTRHYYSELGGYAIFVLPVVALTGALFSAAVIYALANRRGIMPQRLILVGIGVNVGINAFIVFYSLRVTQVEYNRILVWTSGSLWGSSWKYFWAVSPIVLLFLILVMYRHKTMDIIGLGDELAIGLGVNADRQRKIILSYAVILAGAATSVAGNIGFLGLLSPHIARRLVGPSHKRFIATSALISVTIIVLADSFSRNLFPPVEIPVGITISLIGVPYFIYLMIREK